MLPVFVQSFFGVQRISLREVRQRDCDEMGCIGWDAVDADQKFPLISLILRYYTFVHLDM